MKLIRKLITLILSVVFFIVILVGMPVLAALSLISNKYKLLDYAQSLKLDQKIGEVLYSLTPSDNQFFSVARLLKDKMDSDKVGEIVLRSMVDSVYDWAHSNSNTIEFTIKLNESEKNMLVDTLAQATCDELSAATNDVSICEQTDVNGMAKQTVDTYIDNFVFLKKEMSEDKSNFWKSIIVDRAVYWKYLAGAVLVLALLIIIVKPAGIIRSSLHVVVTGGLAATFTYVLLFMLSGLLNKISNSITDAITTTGILKDFVNEEAVSSVSALITTVLTGFAAYLKSYQLKAVLMFLLGIAIALVAKFVVKQVANEVHENLEKREFDNMPKDDRVVQSDDLEEKDMHTSTLATNTGNNNINNNPSASVAGVDSPSSSANSGLDGNIDLTKADRTNSHGTK